MEFLQKKWLTWALFAVLGVAAFAPLFAGNARFPQWLEVVLGGLMSGVLYSLVALGLVLIFKASGVFNFAQGAMVLFAALSLVRLMEFMPLAVALIVTMAIMVVVAWLIERLVLRPLVNQEGIVLFMATLGIAYFLDGLGQTIWGSDIYTLDVGMPKTPRIFLESTFEGGILVGMEDVIAAILAATLVGLAFAGVFGSAITGMMYKITPFLNWLHLQRLGAPMSAVPNMKKMLSAEAMTGQLRLHVLALLLLLAAVWMPGLARLAGVVFAGSSAWLAWNLIGAARRYRTFRDQIRAVALHP